MNSWLDALKSVAILAIIVILVFRHDIVNSFLDTLNVTKLSFGGMEIDRTEAIKALAAAGDNLQKTQSDLEATRNELAAVAAKYQTAVAALKATQAQVEAIRAGGGTPGSAEVSKAVEDALSQATPALAAATTATASATDAVNSTKEAVQTLPTTPSSGANFAVIFGGDASVEAAASEVAKAQKAGFEAAQIYLRQNSYRSAVPFQDKVGAQSAIAQIRKISRTAADAYIVNLANWCPKPSTVGPGVLNCGF